MASTNTEKNPSGEPQVTTSIPSEDSSAHQPAPGDLVASNYSGLKYKSRRIGPFTVPHYASPSVQLTLVAFVCFLCPGMFNAVNGLGGGGQFDAESSDNANVAVYSTFAALGFFAGSIVNRLGIKLTLSLGGLGYVLYIASYLSYNHNQNEGFVIFAGAVLGLCAGMLWAAQGAIMMSYPHEES